MEAAMRETKKYYLKILRIEIEDLREDIEFLIKELERERESELLSEYVFLENLTVFHSELYGVDFFFKVLDDINPDNFESLDEMISFIEESFKIKIKQAGLPDALNIYVKRKLLKVRDYITKTK
jgi:hypothetical protein